MVWFIAYMLRTYFVWQVDNATATVYLLLTTLAMHSCKSLPKSSCYKDSNLYKKHFFFNMDDEKSKLKFKTNSLPHEYWQKLSSVFRVDNTSFLIYGKQHYLVLECLVVKQAVKILSATVRYIHVD